MSKLIRLEDVKDRWHAALDAELENGVAWMNDEAWEKFPKQHPFLWKFHLWLMGQEDDDE